MFIGHLPAGYIATSIFLQNCPTPFAERVSKRLLWVGLVASIFPDFDLLYFYLIDNRQHLHHSYWIHIPFYWTLIIGTAFLVSVLVKSRTMLLTSLVIGFNIFLHLLLDTIAGKIRWFYPFSQYDVVLFHVPARYSWWMWNFVFHWTFLLEFVVIFAAISFWYWEKTKVMKWRLNF